MPPPEEREAIAIVLDIGPCNSKVESYQGFLQKAKKCIIDIILRKMFAESKDAMCIILVGSEETDNELAASGKYQHIDVIVPFKKISWEFVDAVSKLQQTNVNGDWLDAVVVGIQCLRDTIDDSSSMKDGYSVTKLVLFSTFTSDVVDDQVDTIVDGMKDNNIELVTIVPDFMFEQTEEDDDGTTSIKKEKILTIGQKLIIKILDEVQMKPFIVDDALSNLSYYRQKKSNRATWSACMYIGNEIRILVNGYKLIVEKPIQLKTKHSTEDVLLQRDQGFFRGAYPVDRSDTVKGCVYGDSIVPVSDIDEGAFKYQPGDKGLFINGFMKNDTVPLHLWVGDSAQYIVGEQKSKDSQTAFAALVRSLHEMKMVALARKVYAKNRGLKMGILIPKIEAKPLALVFVELPFADQIKFVWFPSLDKVAVSEAQLGAIDQLIDNMDLTAKTPLDEDEEEEEEPYSPEILLNPKNQYTLHCIAQKGLQDKSDPDYLDIPKAISCLIKPMPHIEENSKNTLERIKELFDLEVVETKVKVEKVEADQLDGIEQNMEVKREQGTESEEGQLGDVANFFQSTISAVGTLTPVEDFMALLKKGEKPLEEIVEQMESVIMELLVRANSVEMLQRPSSALKCLRKTCIESKSSQIYNAWLVKLKETVVKREQRDFWDIIVKEKIGLITVNDMPYSYVTPEEGEEFFKFEVLNDDNEEYMEMDDDDLLMDI